MKLVTVLALTTGSVIHARCPRNLDIDIFIRNVPKMDKESNSDVFFELTDSKGNKVHTSNTIRNIKGEAQFARFTHETEKTEPHTMKMTDVDKGFMNFNDEIAEFPIKFQQNGPGEWFDVHKKNPDGMEFKQSKTFPFQMRIDTKRVPVCKNGGFCRSKGSGASAGFDCVCDKKWEGKYCEVDVNECALDDSLCGERGTCVNTQGGYECKCDSGWTGKTCTEDVDECAADHSVDVCPKATQLCSNKPGGYDCICKGGWSGDNCEDDFDECSLDPCKSIPGTTCKTDKFNSFTCECDSEYGCMIAVQHPDKFVFTVNVTDSDYGNEVVDVDEDIDWGDLATTDSNEENTTGYGETTYDPEE